MVSLTERAIYCIICHFHDYWYANILGTSFVRHNAGIHIFKIWNKLHFSRKFLAVQYRVRITFNIILKLDTLAYLYLASESLFIHIFSTNYEYKNNPSFYGSTLLTRSKPFIHTNTNGIIHIQYYILPLPTVKLTA
jgi:hypothetical protein